MAKLSQPYKAAVVGYWTDSQGDVDRLEYFGTRQEAERFIDSYTKQSAFKGSGVLARTDTHDVLEYTETP